MHTPISVLTIAVVVHCIGVAGCQSVEQQSPRLINPPSQIREIDDTARRIDNLVSERLQDGVANCSPLSVNVATEGESVPNEDPGNQAQRTRNQVLRFAVHPLTLFVIGFVLVGGRPAIEYIGLSLRSTIGLSYCWLKWRLRNG